MKYTVDHVNKTIEIHSGEASEIAKILNGFKGFQVTFQHPVYHTPYYYYPYQPDTTPYVDWQYKNTTGAKEFLDNTTTNTITLN